MWLIENIGYNLTLGLIKLFTHGLLNIHSHKRDPGSYEGKIKSKKSLKHSKSRTSVSNQRSFRDPLPREPGRGVEEFRAQSLS